MPQSLKIAAINRKINNYFPRPTTKNKELVTPAMLKELKELNLYLIARNKEKRHINNSVGKSNGRTARNKKA